MAAAAIPIAIGVASGLVKQQAQQKEFERQRELAAKQAPWSSWTGIKPDTSFKKPDLASNAIGGGIHGAAFSQENPGLFGATKTAPSLYSGGVPQEGFGMSDPNQSAWMKYANPNG